MRRTGRPWLLRTALVDAIISMGSPLKKSFFIFLPALSEWGIHHLAGFFFLNLIPSSIRMISNGMYPFPQRFTLPPVPPLNLHHVCDRSIMNDKKAVDKKSSVFLSFIPEMEIISIDAFVCFWFICEFSSVFSRAEKAKVISEKIYHLPNLPTRINEERKPREWKSQVNNGASSCVASEREWSDDNFAHQFRATRVEAFYLDASPYLHSENAMQITLLSTLTLSHPLNWIIPLGFNSPRDRFISSATSRSLTTLPISFISASLFFLALSRSIEPWGKRT